MKLDDIPDVDLDDEGVFKYILISVKHNQTGEEKTIVRGYEECEYHADILDRVAVTLEPFGYSCRCPGGGRIKRTSSEVFVYGYSVGFGRGDHDQVCQIIKTYFNDNSLKIHWSNEGY